MRVEFYGRYEGIPQGTKILFAIMINDLAVKSPLIADHWKFVDDVTLSEVVKTESISVLHTDLDTISAWAKGNNMNLNPKKCKEMMVCPLKHTPDLVPLLLNKVPLDKVVSHKVLRMTIIDNLKWNKNTNEIISKASKRLHIIRVLKKACVRSNDLTCIYSSLVRSTLEYCCVLWCNSIPEYLCTKIEMIQKRAMRIIFPDYHYSEALIAANFSRLDERRLEICQKV
jgi:hypothetical protein